MQSARTFNKLLHGTLSSCLERTFPLSGKEPDPFVLVLTVKEVHAIAGHRVVKAGAGLEEKLAAR